MIIAEKEKIQEDFTTAEEKLMQALAKLDGVIGGTLEKFTNLKKELAGKQAAEQPLLGNSEIRALQNENKKLSSENEEIRLALAAEKAKNEKLAKIKRDASDRIENLITQLEKAVAA